MLVWSGVGNHVDLDAFLLFLSPSLLTVDLQPSELDRNPVLVQCIAALLLRKISSTALKLTQIRLLQPDSYDHPSHRTTRLTGVCEFQSL